MKRSVKLFLLVMGIGIIAPLVSMQADLMPAQGVSSVAASDPAASGETETVTLHVDGMTCRSCVPAIRKALLRIPGVRNALVDYDQARAEVACEKGKVTNEQLVKAIEDQSNPLLTFSAQVTSRK